MKIAFNFILALHLLNSSLTLSDIKERIASLTNQNAQSVIKLQQLQCGERKVDPESKIKLDKEYDVVAKAWKKRKKMVLFGCHGPSIFI